MARLLEHPEIDAVFAASDLAPSGPSGRIRATGAGARRCRGGRVRRHPGAGEKDPALTTVRQPVAELGAEMTRVLLAGRRIERPRQATVGRRPVLARASSARAQTA